MWRNRNLQRWSSLHMFRQVPHPQKVRLHPKVRWHSWLRRKFKAGWEEIQNPTQRRVLKRDCKKMHTLAGWWTQQRRNLSQQKRSQGMWTFPNLKLGDRLLIEQLRRNPLQQVNQTTGEVQKLKGQHGHKIYTRLWRQFITRKQSSRSPGKSTDEKRTTLWMVWTWIWLCGAYLWIPLFEQQFILDKTMRRIYDTWRSIFGTVWDSYSMRMRNWSVNKEVTGVSTYNFKDCTSMSTSLLCSKVQ